MYNKYINLIKTSFEESNIIDRDDKFSKQKKFQYLNLYANNEHALAIIYNQTNGNLLFASDNFEKITNYSNALLEDNGLMFFFSKLVPSHKAFPILGLNWVLENSNKIPKDDFKTDSTIIYTGIQLINANNEAQRCLLRFIPIEFGENNLSANIYFATINIINHLIKGNEYWCRMACGKDEKHKFYYNPFTEVKANGDILSKREKEILKLIAEGLESKEIAQKLSISFFTVYNHRKNMLEKTYAKDTTALIQICKMCNII